jgi:hypothetical protein
METYSAGVILGYAHGADVLRELDLCYVRIVPTSGHVDGYSLEPSRSRAMEAFTDCPRN